MAEPTSQPADSPQKTAEAGADRAGRTDGAVQNGPTGRADDPLQQSAEGTRVRRDDPAPPPDKD